MVACRDQPEPPDQKGRPTATMTPPRSRAVAAVALLVLGLAACGGEADGSHEAATPEGQTAAPPESQTAGPPESQTAGPQETTEHTTSEAFVQEALTQLPNENDWVQVTVGDLAGAAEAAGQTISADDQLWRRMVVGGLPAQDVAEVDREDLDHAPVTVVIPGLLEGAYQATELLDVTDEIGWSPYDVETVTALTGGPTGIEEFMVVTGDFPEDALSGHLAELSGGVWTLGEGEDMVPDFDEGAPIFDSTRRPTRLAQDGNQIAVGLRTEPVQAWASGPQTSSAGDRAELADPAAVLDEAGSLSALLLRPRPFDGMTIALGLDDPGAEVDPDERQARLSDWLEQLSTQTFGSLAVGFSVVEGQARATLVYHFATPEAAERAVPTIETLLAGSTFDESMEISSALTIDSVEARDNLVVVTGTQPPGTSWALLQSWLSNGEPPFVRL